MVRNPVTADPDRTIAVFIDETAATSRHSLYPVVRDGELVGVLPFGRVAHIPRDEWPRRAVGECMLPPNALPVLSEVDHLFDALAGLSEAARSRGAVLPDGPLVGLLSLTDIEARARRKQTLRKARRAGRGRSSRGREHIAVARA